ncbi:OLC1v1017584C1 [Oldenlandia corymbosa var. corymbosa]|uniref:OLC1v1017584C1 n=1 Tax=Oldenlandia corymbosa var. corymbosa TaxID=529605 RepID=A0AAV1E9Z5_OLDCO|nr:OLC1v1017584C1 [Oldenlandia corymbosa var. corymbosa]
MFNSTFPPPPPPSQGQAAAVHDNGGGAIPNACPTVDCNLIYQYFKYHLDLEDVDQSPKITKTSTMMFEGYHSSNSSFTSTTNITTPFVSSSQMISSGSSSAGSFDGVAPMDQQDDLQLDDECKKDEKKAKVGGQVIALRTQTELETLDDGFKWRKYGKKMVKSNPNPRHYYKCLIEGCKVKKRVERDGEDSSYLITTYFGKHNHESSGAGYCDRSPFILVLRPSQST